MRTFVQLLTAPWQNEQSSLGCLQEDKCGPLNHNLTLEYSDIIDGWTRGRNSDMYVRPRGEPMRLALKRHPWLPQAVSTVCAVPRASFLMLVFDGPVRFSMVDIGGGIKQWKSTMNFHFYDYAFSPHLFLDHCTSTGLLVRIVRCFSRVSCNSVDSSRLLSSSVTRSRPLLSINYLSVPIQVQHLG
jgi:hypothetical protein